MIESKVIASVGPRTRGYTLLTDWLRPHREAARTVAVRRFETPPGKQAQGYWGHLGSVEMNGEERKLWGFAFTLATAGQ